MPGSVIVTLAIPVALGYAMRAGRHDQQMITRTPYNNRSNDASGARDEAMAIR